MEPVKSGSYNRLTILSEVIYIILEIWSIKDGSVNSRKLLTGRLLSKVYCVQYIHP